MKLVVLGVALFMLSGCAALIGGNYDPKDMTEWVKQAEAINASGCIYMRGNARPYADVSTMYIAAYGKKAPSYLECLQAIPEPARGNFLHELTK